MSEDCRNVAEKIGLKYVPTMVIVSCERASRFRGLGRGHESKILKTSKSYMKRIEEAGKYGGLGKPPPY